MAKTKSTAKLVDEAFVRLQANRLKYRFPEIAGSQDVSDNWNVVYSIPHKSVDEVRKDADFINKYLGRIPWKQQKSG